ncbi:MAG: ABC transporter permease, partial [Candidatus Aminicenantes bacterium]|nr:ABC transporter permease [Candidatus Aminicenantes bacterium]
MKVPDLVLRFLLRDEEYLEKSGDLEEAYLDMVDETGPFRAKAWFWFEVLKALPGFIRNLVSWRVIMLRNYLGIGVRQLRKRKGFSFINILGLALGMACFFLIFLLIRFELSFDDFHEHRNDIYRVNQELTINGARSVGLWTPYEVGRALAEEFPEVSAAARLYSLFNINILVRSEGKIFFEPRHILADPSFFGIFSFPVTFGDPERLLPHPNSVVISERAAKKYFGNGDPLGRLFTVNDDRDFTVSGVVRIPDNTDFQYDFIFPLKAFEKDIDYGWNGLMYQTFVRLKKGILPGRVEEKIWALQKKNSPESSRKSGLRFQKLSRIHLYGADGEPGETARYLAVFGLSGVFILLIACVNFMNLSTARSEQRAREVGIRKTVGAERSQIIRQFYVESFLVTTLACLCAVLLVLVFLPAFRQLVGARLSLGLTNPSVVIGLVAAWGVTAVVSGGYPALFLSSFRPIQVLRGKFIRGSRSASRKGLVVFQFSLSVFFMISTLVVYSQLRFIDTRYEAMDKSRLVYLRMDGGSDARGPLLKEALRKYPEIQSLVVTQQLPLSIRNNRAVWTSPVKSPDTRFDLFYNMADFDFVKTFNMEIVEGRDFSEGNAIDGLNCILNEEAVRQLGLENPVGRKIVYWDDKVGTVVGVVKDFNYQRVNRPIQALVLCARSDWWNRKYLVARLAPGDPRNALDDIRREWSTTNPGIPLELGFFDEVFDRIYRNERVMGKVFLAFASLTIFISCLGLFGLASFMAERRKKEVVVRKVLGASVSRISVMLTGGFTKWVLAANVIAWPAAYLAMRMWLQGYAYR